MTVDLVLWILWFLLMSVVAAVGLLHHRGRTAERTAQRLARRSGLALVPAVRAVVDRRLALQRRSAAIGGCSALAVVSALLGAAAGWHWSEALSWSLAGAAFVCGTIGSAGAAVQHEPLQPSVRRIARTRPTTVADYLPLPERIAARVLPAFGLATTAIITAAGPDRAVLPIATGALVLVAVVLFEAGSRRVIGAAQQARTADDLAWDDAFRSAGLRTLALAPMAAGAYAGFAASWSLDPDGSAGAAAGALAAVVVAVFALRSESVAVGRYFLGRLWPETARALEARPEVAT